MPLILKRFAIAVVSTVLIYGAIALGLIVSQAPAPLPPQNGLDFSALGTAPHSQLPLGSYTARDGSALGLRQAGPVDAASLVVIVHGSGWHGGGYQTLASFLAQQGHRVLLPDLRGHGPAPRRRGDIDYIGQLEDDLADLITGHVQPGQRVTLIGHSSGGGLVVRFAGGAHGGLLDRAVLIAPFLKYNAPTMRDSAGGWSFPLTRRIIGLTMLNQAGIAAFNHLTAIQFNFPQEVLNGPLGQTATSSYSFRLNTAYAPRNDYLADVAALPPFLLIAGADDEAFVAAAYQPALSSVTDHGSYAILPGLTHFSVLSDPSALSRIADFVDG
jgi:alpha-beta hydrolase superfamily lysophospholipase